MELFKLPESIQSRPAQLLAFDEALLDHCDATEHPGFLTFWESTTYFVVLGYGKRMEEEVFTDECARLGISILRRCSGGGTVLQGPGCLNYSVVLPISSAPEFETISGANHHIVERIRSAIAPLVPGKMEAQGHTDLTLDGLKFSGNAQRRKRRSLLFHGSFLLNFELPLISRTLRQPKQQPAYRGDRPHEYFLTNLPADRVHIENRIIEAWNSNRETSAETRSEIMTAARRLAEGKYSRPEWNFEGRSAF